MDAFTRRVELEDEDDATSPAQPPHLHPSSGDVPVIAADVDSGGQSTPDDDQVVPGQEPPHVETTARRRQPFYEGTPDKG